MSEANYVGLKKIKGKLTCNNCNTIEPEVKMTTHINGVDFSTWSGTCKKCNNIISITYTKKSNFN